MHKDGVMMSVMRIVNFHCISTCTLSKVEKKKDHTCMTFTVMNRVYNTTMQMEQLRTWCPLSRCEVQQMIWKRNRSESALKVQYVRLKQNHFCALDGNTADCPHFSQYVLYSSWHVIFSVNRPAAEWLTAPPCGTMWYWRTQKMPDNFMKTNQSNLSPYLTQGLFLKAHTVPLKQVQTMIWKAATSHAPTVQLTQD